MSETCLRGSEVEVPEHVSPSERGIVIPYTTSARFLENRQYHTMYVDWIIFSICILDDNDVPCSKGESSFEGGRFAEVLCVPLRT